MTQDQFDRDRLSALERQRHELNRDVAAESGIMARLFDDIESRAEIEDEDHAQEPDN